mgnify:CR=1 FL=1
MPLNPASVMTAQPLNIQSPLDAYARVLAAQHAQTQNVLAQQQLAEYQRARGEDEAVRNYFVKAQTAGTPTTSPEFVQGLLGISPARGMSYQQNVAAAQKAATEESARRAKLALDKIAMYRDALVNVRTPEQGYQWVMAQVNDPDLAGTPISKMSVMNVVIPTDPKEFQDWKNREALGATEFVVLEVDVVDDLADRGQGGVGKAGMRHQHLEGAAVADMGELAFEHVEAQLAGLGRVTARGHELERGVAIDEAADQPGRRDAVDLDAPARHPGALAQCAGGRGAILGGHFPLPLQIGRAHV